MLDGAAPKPCSWSFRGELLSLREVLVCFAAPEWASGFLDDLACGDQAPRNLQCPALKPGARTPEYPVKSPRQ